MASPGQWQPEEEATKQLVGYLRDALSAHNPTAQKNATVVCVHEFKVLSGPWLTVLVRSDAHTGQKVPGHSKVPRLYLYKRAVAPGAWVGPGPVKSCAKFRSNKSQEYDQRLLQLNGRGKPELREILRALLSARQLESDTELCWYSHH